MRIFGQVVLFVFLVLNPVFAFSEDLGLVRLSLIEGDVQVLIKDSTDWTAAEVNLPLNEGDRILGRRQQQGGISDPRRRLCAHGR